MNNLVSIQDLLEYEFPQHYVALTEAGWPYGLRYELVGPHVQFRHDRVERLQKITGCRNTLGPSTLHPDDSGNYITEIQVYT